MTTSSPYNDRFPTDPTTWAVLLILAALAIGSLNNDQARALSGLFEAVVLLSPALIRRR